MKIILRALNFKDNLSIFKKKLIKTIIKPIDMVFLTLSALFMWD